MPGSDRTRVEFRRHRRGGTALDFGPEYTQHDLRFQRPRDSGADLDFGGRVVLLDGAGGPHNPGSGVAELGGPGAPSRTAELDGQGQAHRPGQGLAELDHGAERLAALESQDAPHRPGQGTADLNGGADRLARIDGAGEPARLRAGTAYLGRPEQRTAALDGAYAPHRPGQGTATLDAGTPRIAALDGAGDAHNPRSGTADLGDRPVRTAELDGDAEAHYPRRFATAYLPALGAPETPPRWDYRSTGALLGNATQQIRCAALSQHQPEPGISAPRITTGHAPGRREHWRLGTGHSPSRQQRRCIAQTDDPHRRIGRTLDNAHAPTRHDGRRIALNDSAGSRQAASRVRANHAPHRREERTLGLALAPYRRTGLLDTGKQAPWRLGCWTLVTGRGGRPAWRWPAPVVALPVDPEPPGQLPPPDPLAVDIDFACFIPLPGSEHVLRFGAPVCIPPIRAVYLVSNVVTAARMPGGEPIGLSRITLRTDRQAWGWRFDAQVADPASAALLRATGAGPHLLLVTINGYAWELLVERMADTRQFPGRGWTIEGRSTLAALAAPHAPVSTAVELQQRTAQQLVANVLDPWGWAVDWRATDWLVPGGVFAYADASPVAAVRQVVAAFDGTMRQARTGQSLIVHDRYQVDPWDWAQAQVDQIITAPILEESQAERPGPGYNGVYVAGQRYGVVARVRRDGTNGTPFAPLASDPLLTEAAANRQRGKAILGAARPKRDVTLNLPVLEAPLQPRLAEIGELVEVDDGQDTWRAQVEAITLTVQRRNGAVSVRQSVQLERDDG